MRLTDARMRQRTLAVAVAWFLIVLVADLATGPEFTPAILYAVAPLIACATLRPPATGGFGVAAIAFTALSLTISRAWFLPQAAIRLLDAILISGVAVGLSAARVRREEQLARISRIAEVAQKTILPLIPTQVGPVAASARYLSAAEDALVGGDLYDWFHVNHRVCFIVGDVRGKGVGAVEQAARVIRAFRQAAAGGSPLAQMAEEMSVYLIPFLDEEEFVTAVLAEITPDSQLRLVSCGHPQPLLVTNGDGANLIALPPCLPLGLGEFYESVTLPWASGDRLLLYTDGLSEARDARGEFLPVLDLADLLRTSTVEDALDKVLGEVHHHVPDGQFTDDLAVLLLENHHGDRSVPVDPRDALAGRTIPTPRNLPPNAS